MELIKMGGDIDESILANFEKDNALTLPEEYRDFLLQNNIVFADPNGFFLKHVSEVQEGESPNDSLGCFLGFSPDDEEKTLAWAVNIYRGRLGTGLLPIATDFAGNVVCLCCEGENVGKIFFWKHEEEGKEDPMCLADSFTDFLNSLTA